MNISILTGRITKELELKGSDDNKYLKFILAVDNPFKKDDASFITCIAFKKTAELIAKYCSKGAKIGVTGYIKTGSYETESGERRYTSDVVVNSIEFLDSKKDAEEKGEAKKEAKKEAADEKVYAEDEFPF